MDRIGHAGTLISAILFLVSPAVADVDQPLCGGDDAVCGRVCRSVSVCCTPAAVARLLMLLIPTRWASGRSSQSVIVMCCRYRRMQRLGVVLVCCLIPDLATLRSTTKRGREGDLRDAGDGLEGSARHGIGTRRLSVVGGAGDAAGISVHTVVISISRSGSSRVARDDLPAVLRGGAIYADSRWCDACDTVAKVLWVGRFHHR